MTLDVVNLENVWLALLVALLAGYFVLGGADLGAQLLRPAVARGRADRRATMAALGPFFFGNEGWLIAFAGVLLGAFPVLEGTLLSGLYPVLVPLLAALAAGKAAVQLRGRARTPSGERAWDVLTTVGGAVPALLWGTVAGVLLNGMEFTVASRRMPRPSGRGGTGGSARTHSCFALHINLVAVIFRTCVRRTRSGPTRTPSRRPGSAARSDACAWCGTRPWPPATRPTACAARRPPTSRPMRR